MRFSISHFSINSFKISSLVACEFYVFADFIHFRAKFRIFKWRNDFYSQSGFVQTVQTIQSRQLPATRQFIGFQFSCCCLTITLQVAVVITNFCSWWYQQIRGLSFKLNNFDTLEIWISLMTSMWRRSWFCWQKNKKSSLRWRRKLS